MKTVDEMIDDIIRREGGYVNHPDDRGGPTKYGITQDTLSVWRGRAVSALEVQALTVPEARSIYRALYYERPKINLLPDPIQPFMLDAAVNHGPVQAVKFLQRSLNDLRHSAGCEDIWSELVVDGVIGPRTTVAATLALAACGLHRVLSDLVDERRAFYHQIVEFNPSQQVFLQGWLNRLKEFEPAEREDELRKELETWKQRALRAEARLADIRHLANIVEG